MLLEKLVPSKGSVLKISCKTVGHERTWNVINGQSQKHYNLQEDVKHTYFNPSKEGETKAVSVSPEFNE
jgi:hypothetical protein